MLFWGFQFPAEKDQRATQATKDIQERERERVQYIL